MYHLDLQFNGEDTYKQSKQNGTLKKFLTDLAGQLKKTGTHNRDIGWAGASRALDVISGEINNDCGISIVSKVNSAFHQSMVDRHVAPIRQPGLIAQSAVRALESAQERHSRVGSSVAGLQTLPPQGVVPTHLPARVL